MSLFGVSSSCIGLQSVIMAFPRHIHILFIKKSSPYLFSGVMAGMGVALLVVFFVLAVVGMYFYYRRQGGAFLPKKFDNTDITKDVS